MGILNLTNKEIDCLKDMVRDKGDCNTNCSQCIFGLNGIFKNPIQPESCGMRHPAIWRKFGEKISYGPYGDLFLAKAILKQNKEDDIFIKF